jgi:Tfp pilus assembly protein PilF
MGNLVKSWVIGSMILLATSCASTSESKRTLSKKERIESLLQIAAAAVAENDTVSALETLNQVQALDDSQPKAYLLTALAYLNKNELELAEKSGRHALSLDPNSSATKNALGKILMEQGKLSEAEPFLKSAASDLLYRDASLPKTNLGMLYYRKMDYANSEIWLNKAIADEGPYTCYARYYLGKVKLEQQDLRTASRNFALSLKGACSGMSEVHLALGQTLIREKKFDQARAKMIEIQRLFPNSDASDKASEYLKGIP